MNSLFITVYLLTCAGREGYLAETLALWRASDWGRVVEPEVLVNEEPGENIPPTVFNGFVRIMRDAFAGPEEYFLILEDDILIARHFRAAMMAWLVFLEGRISLAHIYDFGLPMKFWQHLQSRSESGISGS